MDGFTLRTRNNGKTSSVTAWDLDLVKHIITYLSKVLQFIGEHNDVRLLSCGSYACELLFAMIRVESNFNNSPENATFVISNYMIVHHIQSIIGNDLEPSRLSMNKTKSVSGGIKINNEMLLTLENLSDAAMWLASTEKSNDAEWLSR